MTSQNRQLPENDLLSRTNQKAQLLITKRLTDFRGILFSIDFVTGMSRKNVSQFTNKSNNF